MSIKKNIVANYLSQLYATGIGILVLPLYIKHMGAEAYGLVGFFSMMQAWFALLDLGLTPTISRETALYRGGSSSALKYRQLIRSLSMIFFGIALLGGGLLFLLAETIAITWLNVKDLSFDEVILVVQIMAVSVALRWMGGLYRGVITGSEKLVWLSSFNVIIATLRFVVVFVTMEIFGFTPTVFFWHQLTVALVELLGLFLIGINLLPSKQYCAHNIGWSFKPVQPALKFSLTIAFTASVWVLVTQVDKLILSGVLTLEEYGFFTLAVLVASGVMFLSKPVSTVIMPRMAHLYAEGKITEMINVYRDATQLVSVLAGSASIMIAFFAERLLYAWTGDWGVAQNAAPILRLYVIGYGVLVLAAFPYYLQYALGNLKYHLAGNLMIAIALIPTIVWAADTYGAVGAGWAWLGINFLYLITWVGFIHKRLFPGLHLSWLLRDGMQIYIPVSCLMAIASWNFPDTNNRFFIIIQLGILGFSGLIIGALCSDLFRRKLKFKFRRYIND